MVYNSCMVKYIKIYRAYGTFDSWALVLTNRYIWESTFTYIWYILEISYLCIKLSSEHFTSWFQNKWEWYNTFMYLSYAGKHTGHMVCSCLNAGPWWCKANPILIYQGVHCCTNVCYLHLDISPLKSVTIVWDFISVHKALQWALYYVIPEQIWMI